MLVRRGGNITQSQVAEYGHRYINGNLKLIFKNNIKRLLRMAYVSILLNLVSLS